jgi:hypothetical protein
MASEFEWGALPVHHCQSCGERLFEHPTRGWISPARKTSIAAGTGGHWLFSAYCARSRRTASQSAPVRHEPIPLKDQAALAEWLDS